MEPAQEIALYVVRYRWAIEELVLDALFQDLNRMTGNRRAQFRLVRGVYRSGHTARTLLVSGELEAECERIKLYQFMTLRESACGMLAFLAERYGDVAALICGIVSTQHGRAKTLGLGIEDTAPKAVATTERRQTAGDVSRQRRKAKKSAQFSLF